MNTLLTFLSTSFVVSVLSCCVNANSEWHSWKSRYNKTYDSPTEELFRRTIWRVNKQLVERHNNRADVSFQMEINGFADLIADTREPLRTLRPNIADNELPVVHTNNQRQPPPDQWDWRTRGVLGPARNQGQLGSSEDIAAVDCLTSMLALRTGRLEELSLQEVEDCCPTNPADQVFGCIHTIGGLCKAADYPSSSDHQCRNTSCQAAIQIGGARTAAFGNELVLQLWVLQMPILVHIDASLPSFQMYKSGIYSDPKCSPTKLDHALLLVGYGQTGSDQYWIVRNSWGAEWGMQGYAYISRNDHNMCGIASDAVMPTPMFTDSNSVHNFNMNTWESHQRV